MLTQAEIPYSSGKWKGRIAADWKAEFPDFDQWQLKHAGETVVNYCSRKVSCKRSNCRWSKGSSCNIRFKYQICN